MCLFRFDYLDEALKRVASSSTRRSSTTTVDTGFRVMPARFSSSARTPDHGRRLQAHRRPVPQQRIPHPHPDRRSIWQDVLARCWETSKTPSTGSALAVVVSLLFVAGNAMAMAMRERTTEVAVLKAIGFNKALVLFLVMAEAVLVAGLGGASARSAARPCSISSISPRTPLVSCPFSTCPGTSPCGCRVSLVIGFLSGFFPAIFAANASVIDGLRKVI